MKLQLLGIAIILFGISFQLSASGIIGSFGLLISLIGLVVTMIGSTVEKHRQ